MKRFVESLDLKWKKENLIRLMNQILLNLSDLVRENKDQIFVGNFEKVTVKKDLTNVDLYTSPIELYNFLSEFHVDGVFFNTNISFTPSEKILRRQEGFELSSQEFIVFADVNDDPIVITPKGEIFAAIEAQNYKLIAPSLEMFFKIQLELCKFDLSKVLVEPDSDLDFENYISFCEEIKYPKYKEIISSLLNDSQMTDNYVDFLWE